MCLTAACRATNFSTGPEDQFFSSELLRRQIQFCFICWQRSARSGLKQIAKCSFFPESTDAFVIHMYSQIYEPKNLSHSAQWTVCLCTFWVFSIREKVLIQIKIQKNTNRRVMLVCQCSRECVRAGAAGAAGARTRRSLGHHPLHPLILRLLVLCAPADFEAQSSFFYRTDCTRRSKFLTHSLRGRNRSRI